LQAHSSLFNIVLHGLDSGPKAGPPHDVSRSVICSLRSESSQD
jgi:hypothetical protein